MNTETSFDEVYNKVSPLSDSAFYTLLCLFAISNSDLVDEERGIHPYGVKRWVRKFSKKVIELPTATIYTVLNRFVDAGVAYIFRQDEKKSYYEITEVGRQVFIKEHSRLKVLGEAAEVVMDGYGVEPTNLPW
ncbi:PadR family transcriptional regulator [Ruminococcaceae bacterium OttesenSCG-928-O06]|nr:PadR family transcriptional regulator [Ruminococcaceae bacterium OttesenSCG-928-O06]